MRPQASGYGGEVQDALRDRDPRHRGQVRRAHHGYIGLLLRWVAAGTATASTKSALVMYLWNTLIVMYERRVH